MTISLEAVRELAAQLSPHDQVRLITFLSARLETALAPESAASAEAWAAYDQLRAEFATLPAPPVSAVTEVDIQTVSTSGKKCLWTGSQKS